MVNTGSEVRDRIEQVPAAMQKQLQISRGCRQNAVGEAAGGGEAALRAFRQLHGSQGRLPLHHGGAGPGLLQGSCHGSRHPSCCQRAW